MSKRVMSDKDYAKLLVPDLLRFVEKPPWESPSYEVRRHMARERLGLDSDEAVEGVKEKMLLAFAKELVKHLYRLLGNKEVKRLKQEAQEELAKGPFSAFDAIIDRLV